MIIWIASYPRSGNTLTTQVFKQVFNKVCYEKYNNFYNYINPIDSDNKNFSKIGLEVYSEKWVEFYKKAYHSEKLYLIKTHHPPEDNCPCIYVLRNGIKAIESHFHYIEKIDKIDCEWNKLIVGGFFPYLTWGRHLDVWSPNIRPNTIIVQFEMLAKGDQSTIENISKFTNLPILSKWENVFDEHKKNNPNFFRRGPHEYESELPESMVNLFSMINGDWMRFFNFSGDWVVHPSQPYIREMLQKNSLDLQECLENNRLLKSQLNWMQSNTNLLNNKISLKKPTSFIQLLKSKIFNP